MSVRALIANISGPHPLSLVLQSNPPTKMGSSNPLKRRQCTLTSLAPGRLQLRELSVDRLSLGWCLEQLSVVRYQLTQVTLPQSFVLGQTQSVAFLSNLPALSYLHVDAFKNTTSESEAMRPASALSERASSPVAGEWPALEVLRVTAWDPQGEPGLLLEVVRALRFPDGIAAKKRVSLHVSSDGVADKARQEESVAALFSGVHIAK